jgi:hypothetical protein
MMPRSLPVNRWVSREYKAGFGAGRPAWHWPMSPLNEPPRGSPQMGIRPGGSIRPPMRSRKRVKRISPPPSSSVMSKRLPFADALEHLAHRRLLLRADREWPAGAIPIGEAARDSTTTSRPGRWGGGGGGGGGGGCGGGGCCGGGCCCGGGGVWRGLARRWRLTRRRVHARGWRAGRRRHSRRRRHAPVWRRSACLGAVADEEHPPWRGRVRRRSGVGAKGRVGRGVGPGRGGPGIGSLGGGIDPRGHRSIGQDGHGVRRGLGGSITPGSPQERHRQQPQDPACHHRACSAGVPPIGDLGQPIRSILLRILNGNVPAEHPRRGVGQFHVAKRVSFTLPESHTPGVRNRRRPDRGDCPSTRGLLLRRTPAGPWRRCQRWVTFRTNIWVRRLRRRTEVGRAASHSLRDWAWTGMADPRDYLLFRRGQLVRVPSMCRWGPSLGRERFRTTGPGSKSKIEVTYS